MNLFADESVDSPIVDLLRQEGHEVTYVAELDPGIVDEEVLALAKQAGFLLLTGDKDFGELVYRLKKAQSGVALIRLSGLSPQRKAEIVADAIRSHGKEMMNAFTVIGPSSVRIRKQVR
jgi:predicted nuclease of predicted toxin-antitoxin system